jgi:hypothetical protein
VGDGVTETVTGTVRPVNVPESIHGVRAASASVEATSAQRPVSAPSRTESTATARAASPMAVTVGVATDAMTSPRRQSSADAPGRPPTGAIVATTASAPGAATTLADTGVPVQWTSRVDQSWKATAPAPAEYADTVTTACPPGES